MGNRLQHGSVVLSHKSGCVSHTLIGERTRWLAAFSESLTPSLAENEKQKELNSRGGMTQTGHIPGGSGSLSSCADRWPLTSPSMRIQILCCNLLLC